LTPLLSFEPKFDNLLFLCKTISNDFIELEYKKQITGRLFLVLLYTPFGACQEVFRKYFGNLLKMPEWSFITNHGLVLAAIAKQPQSTAREIGDTVGITERAAHNIISDLDEAGYITKTKVGRRNRYRIHPNVPLKDEASDAAVGELLVMLGWKRRKRRTSTEISKKGN